VVWKWFGVKTLYRTTVAGTPPVTDSAYDPSATLVEERVVILRARSHDEAHRKAKAEARRYATRRHVNPYGQRVRTRWVGASESFELFDEPDNLTEVWSSTYMIPASVSDKEVVARALGPNETAAQRKRRRKFLNREFSGTVP
jgi:Domain of unknown function (DUF4288)